MHSITFNGSPIKLTQWMSQAAVTATELGRALGYKDEKSVQRLYRRNEDEFTEAMTGMVNMTTPSGAQRVRVFSLRGAHLVAMFAKTKMAKAFRRRVLDVLDAESARKSRLQELHDAACIEHEAGRRMASMCGKGLAGWRYEKHPLEQRIALLEEQIQMSLPLLSS
ncbi:hypothetical protein [Vreelandella maris]|uniref:hypothetical protein n=1 Tax=Vreelandella maris TaxID=2729617 RepID=UPI0030EBEAFB|tara:strand:+ start:910 stop:1407 length:498 start_codon:yes stop_codon:yes gene_type:complete